MNNFKDGGFKKGGRDFGGRPKFGNNKFGGDRRSGGNSFGGGRDRGDRNNRDGRSSEMFPATCSSCHKDCEVPFRPSGDKPVFCSACFSKQNGDDSRGDDRRGGRSERSDYTKLPRDQRPPRHDKSRGQDDGGLADVKRQLATIESRLNRILDVLNPPTKPEKSNAPVVATVPKKERKPKAGAVKKVVDAPALKQVLSKVTEEAPVKKTTKKVAKKAAKKTTKKTTKKVAKKAVKKTSK